MPTIQLSGPELLNAVRQLEPQELDAFLEQALSLRKHRRAGTLSAAESGLIKRINRGLPEELSRHYGQLVKKRKKGSLAEAERAELLKLSNKAESLDAERAAALLELAKLRRVPIRMVMKQMGIKAAPLDG